MGRCTHLLAGVGEEVVELKGPPVASVVAVRLVILGDVGRAAFGDGLDTRRVEEAVARGEGRPRLADLAEEEPLVECAMRPRPLRWHVFRGQPARVRRREKPIIGREEAREAHRRAGGGGRSPS